MAKCGGCGAEITGVRDNYTGAMFQVDAEPVRVKGFVLSAPREGERSPRAVLQEFKVHEPHHSCLKSEGPPPEDQEP